MLNAESSFSPCTLPEFESFPESPVAQIPDPCLADSAFERLTRHEVIGLTAVDEALAEAGWRESGLPADEVGVFAGVGAAGMLEAEQWYRKARCNGDFSGAWESLRGYPASSLADTVAERTGFASVRSSVATACSSGSAALGLAAQAIRRGRCKAALVVGSEALNLLTMAGFASLKSIDPQRCRPFDRDRKGIVLGEGAGALFLEGETTAQERGATVWGCLAGWGWAADCHHMSAPHPEGRGAVRAIRQALESSGLPPERVGYVNMHGTGTRLNDAAETKAMKTVFGEYADRMLFSSTKSMTGHCLGAAGAVESVLTLMALKHGMIPPTANLEHPDPECDLDYAPGTARSAPDLTCAVNNVMAFGGNVVALAFTPHES